MDNTVNIEELGNSLISSIEEMELKQLANEKTRSNLEEMVTQLIKENQKHSEELDIVVHALTLLREISDESVAKNYKFIEDNVNSALALIFPEDTKRIKLEESTRNGQYPQLDLLITLGDGVVRRVRSDGHGVAQVISLLSILSLICITGCRRILVIDEVLSGCSGRTRRIVGDILNQFTTIGFKFIIVEHGFIPKGSIVYQLQEDKGTARIVREWTEEDGVFLNGELERIEI